MSDSLPARIYAAITEDPQALPAIFAAHPEELNAHTFMAGQTWLGYAAQKGRLDAIRILVSLGADLNKGNSHVGARPLVSACMFGHHEVAEYLLEQGSLIDTHASVTNPLFAAIIGRSPDCVKLLLRAGIDASVRYTSETMTDMDAVAFALMRGEQECAEIIADHLSGGDAADAQDRLEVAERVAEMNVYSPRSARGRAAARHRVPGKASSTGPTMQISPPSGSTIGSCCSWSSACRAPA
jgi:hypothetical protein